MSFKKLSELQLSEYLLLKGISIDATEKLKNEEIDGTAFLELNALLLHAMGIKMGQAIKIQAIIEGKKGFLRLSCYLCTKKFQSTNDYTYHLRNTHLLFEPCFLRCNADGCMRTFTLYKVLRKHIKKTHMCHNNLKEVDKHSDITIQNTENEYLAEDYNEVLYSESLTKESVAKESVFVAPIVDEYGVSHAALKFLMSLQSSSSISLSVSQFIMDSLNELLKDIINYLLAKTDVVLKTYRCDAATFNTLSEEFNNWKNPFKGIDTHYKMLNYLKVKGLYVEPEAHSIGDRWDVKRDRSTKQKMQVCVKNKFYLIPIEKTLKLVLRQPETWKILKRNNESANDIAEDWLDGKHGRQLKTYAKHYFPNSIHVFIQIYFDEVETTNPLGSKTGIHKLGAFYFTIKNFPPAANSALSNIHLLALAHSEDIKRYTTDTVMEVIVQQLKDLHDEGFTVFCDGKEINIRCFLTQVVGDNLGLHAILGYKENFSSASFACDLCMATQDEMQKVFCEYSLTMRTQQSYEQHIEQLNNGTILSKECGIKRPSTLKSLNYYHPACNDSADIMHDLFEGVIPFEVKLFLRHIIYDLKLINLHGLNCRINTMDYGLVSNSKPSFISESHLKSHSSLLGQRSAQMLILFLHLPCILADVIDKVDTLKWRLYQLLKQLTENILLPNSVLSHVLYLKDLVSEHHELFKICYPDKRLLYKHHRMVHYGTIIENSGPLLHMMVMRFEAKHNFSKRLAHIISNFKNIAFSLASRHQLSHAFVWMTRCPLKGISEVGNGTIISSPDIKHKSLILPFIGEK
ncbi:uncharacterized protein LOC101236011 [Hydra vulgaris]|uniref:uncharacterized protein LOC101236011 n=1 Tax=Hydra vulgaris TaxID=6087 RepID=UPI0032EA0E59